MSVSVIQVYLIRKSEQLIVSTVEARKEVVSRLFSLLILIDLETIWNLQLFVIWIFNESYICASESLSQITRLYICHSWTCWRPLCDISLELQFVFKCINHYSHLYINYRVEKVFSIMLSKVFISVLNRSCSRESIKEGITTTTTKHNQQWWQYMLSTL